MGEFNFEEADKAVDLLGALLEQCARVEARELQGFIFVVECGDDTLDEIVVTCMSSGMTCAAHDERARVVGW